MHEQHARRDTVKMLHKVGAEDLGSVEDQEEDQGAEGAEDAEDQEDADIKYKYNIWREHAEKDAEESAENQEKDGEEIAQEGDREENEDLEHRAQPKENRFIIVLVWIAPKRRKLDEQFLK